MLFESISFSNCSTIGDGGCVYISFYGNNLFFKVYVHHSGTKSVSYYYFGQIYYSASNCMDKLIQVSGENCGCGDGDCV